MASNDNRSFSTSDCRAVRSRLGTDLDKPTPDVVSHLEHCASCRAETRRLNAAWALLNAVEPREPSSRFAAGVWAKIAAHDRAGSLRSAWSLRWAAAGLAVALAVAVPATVWYRSAQDRPELLAQVDVMASHDLLVNMDVVEDLDVLLLLDDP
ncbi:MAG: hypothetical protein ACOYXU_09090 [Nitrospirota bacterium]